MHSLHIEHLIQIYRSATTVKSGKYYTTVNELADQIPATRPKTLLAATTSLISLGPICGNKILCEEDKGAALGALFSIQSSLPLAMARWYSYELPSSIKVPVNMEYYEGNLYVNGIQKNDNIIIIDDTLSSGGTIVSLAKATKKANAKIVDVRVVVEKLNYGGRKRIINEVGINVKAVIGISIGANGKISIDEILGESIR